MNSIEKSNIEIDRKILAHLASEDNSTFKTVFDVAVKTLNLNA